MENWDVVFSENNVSIIFNKFLDTYLKIFNIHFKQTKYQPLQKINLWITKGIRISCYKKRTLYLSCRNSTNKKLINRYKAYSRILLNVITVAKKMYNDELIPKSKNKIKATWQIIKNETGKCKHPNTIEALMINTMVNNSQEIARKFNDYFSTVANTITNNTKTNNDGRKKRHSLLQLSY